MNKELNTQLCYNITFGNEKSDRIITVSAKNSAGLSLPSTIIVPNYPGEIQNVFSLVEKVVFKLMTFLLLFSQTMKTI